MAATLGFTTSVIGLAEVITNLLSAFRIRVDRFRSHPEHFEILVQTHDRISEKLQALRTSRLLETDGEHYRDLAVVQTHVNGASSQLDELSAFLDQSIDEFEEQESKFGVTTKEQVRRGFKSVWMNGRTFSRTSRINDALQAVQKHLDSAWLVLNDIKLARIERSVDLLCGAGHDVERRLVAEDAEDVGLDLDGNEDNRNGDKCGIGTNSDLQKLQERTSDIASLDDNSGLPPSAGVGKKRIPVRALVVLIALSGLTVIDLVVSKPLTDPPTPPLREEHVVLYSTFAYADFTVSVATNGSVWIVQDSEENRHAFRIVPGLAGEGVSLESVDKPGHFFRHQNWDLWLHPKEHTELFQNDSTFIKGPGLALASGVSFESLNFPHHFIRHSEFRLKIGESIAQDLFKRDASWRIQEVEQ